MSTVLVPLDGSRLAERALGPVLLESALIVAAYLAWAWLLYRLGA